MVNIFIVIVTYNGVKWLDKSIGASLTSVLPNQIIVVDNGSTDNTVSYIKENYPGLHLIEAKSNLGFGKANNIGIEIALNSNADFIFLLNQDAWFLNDCLARLVAIQLKYPEFGILSAMHVNAASNALDYNFSNYIIPNKCQDFYSDLYFNLLKEVYEVEFVNAAGWLISKDCFKKVGLFDPLFFHYFEDNNYCNRILYHHLKIGICPSAQMVHDRPSRKGIPGSFELNSFKVKLRIAELADIRNNNFKKEYNKTIMSYFTKAILNLIMFRMKQFSYYYHSMVTIKRLKKDIIKSRERNSLLHTVQ